MSTLAGPLARAVSTVPAAQLHDLLLAGREYALLDVREVKVAAEQGSILLGVSLPLSRLELRVGDLVPRRGTPVVVYDGGEDDDLARCAAARLAELGYTDVRVLDGGIAAWKGAGYKVHHGGEQVIGQAFGEWVGAVRGTPQITVEDYRARLAAGADVVLLDSRPIREFERHSLPGGTSVPGAELVRRAAEVVTSPDTLVVVHCAGRTRSILGAQTLIDAGLPNRVVALEGGTQAWVLEGHRLEHGRRTSAPPPGAGALRSARRAAQRFRDRFGIRRIDRRTLAAWQAQAEERTLYVFDVRTPEEYAADRLPGSRSVPSWDLMPWVFRHAATRHARIVLVDDDEVRASVTAAWITQIGWAEAVVLGGGLSGLNGGRPGGGGPGGAAAETGRPAHAPASAARPGRAITRIGAAQLQRLLAAGTAQVVDLQHSLGYRAGHIPGAVFALRSRLAASADDVPGAGTIVLTSKDGVLAEYAAADLAGTSSRPVAVLDGGTAAWVAAGGTLQRGDTQLLHPADDVVFGHWQETDPEAQKAGFRRYLSWQLGLVAELAQDDTVPFRAVPSGAVPSPSA